MKVLFTCLPSYGQFTSLVPIAKALQLRGVEVTFATSEIFRQHISDEGFVFYPAGLDYDESDIECTLPEILHVPCHHRADFLDREIRMNCAASKMFNDLGPIVGQFDIVVYECQELGGALAAEKAKIPSVRVNANVSLERGIDKIINGNTYASLRKNCGLEPDPSLSAIGRYLDVHLLPEKMKFVNALTSDLQKESLVSKIFGIRGGSRARAVNMYVASYALKLFKQQILQTQTEGKRINVSVWKEKTAAVEKNVPTWIQSMPKDRKTIYFTMGSLFGQNAADVYKKAINALSNHDVNLVISTGKGFDISSLGVTPSNVYVKEFIAPELVLPHADICVSNGGFATCSTALAFGVPQIMFPQNSNEAILTKTFMKEGVCVPLPHQIEQIDGNGMIVCCKEKITEKHISDLVEKVLNYPSYAHSARNMAQKVEEMMSCRAAADEIIEICNASSESQEQQYAIAV